MNDTLSDYVGQLVTIEIVIGPTARATFSGRLRLIEGHNGGRDFLCVGYGSNMFLPVNTEGYQHDRNGRPNEFTVTLNDLVEASDEVNDHVVYVADGRQQKLCK